MFALNLKLTTHFFKEEPQAAAQKLSTLEPQDAASILVEVPISSTLRVISAMSPNVASNVLACCPEDYTRSLFTELELSEIAFIMRYMDKVTRQRLLGLLPKNKQILCKLLVSYPQNTIGALIKTNILVVDNKMLVADVILRLKKHDNYDDQSVYVVNSQRQLIGVISVFELFRASTSLQISVLKLVNMEQLNGLTDLDTAVQSSVWMKSDVVAIVDRKKQIIGVLFHRDLRHAINRNNIESIQSGEEVFDNLFTAYASSFASAFGLLSQTNQ